MWLGGVVLLVGIFAILHEQESKKEQANEETSYRSALVPKPALLFALDPQAFCLPGRMSLAPINSIAYLWCHQASASLSMTSPALVVLQHGHHMP